MIAAGRSLGERHAGRTRCSRRPACRRAGRAPSGRCSRAGDRPVDAGGDRRQLRGDVAVVVPVVRRPARAAPDLHEPDAALEQPPGDQATAAEIGGGRVVQAVEPARRRGLPGEVERLGGAAPASARPARRRRSATRAACRPGWRAACSRFICWSSARPSPRSRGVMNGPTSGGNRSGIGFGGAGLEDRPLVDHRQEARREVPLVVVGQAARVGQDDERRQVVAETAQAVRQPGPQARESRASGTRCSSCSWPARGRWSSTPAPSGTPGRRRSRRAAGRRC